MIIRSLVISLLTLTSLTAYADHQQPLPTVYEAPNTAFNCYDANDRFMSGLWNPRDARLIKRVGGSCHARDQDDGDVSGLEAEALSQQDIEKALCEARERFPQLLGDAWLVGANRVRSSGARYVKYELLYTKIDSDEQVKVKVKQNLWSGKIKRMKPTLIASTHYYGNH